MSETLTPLRSLPLTDLAEDEASLRDVVRDFAKERVAPLVSKMDEEERLPREKLLSGYVLLIPKSKLEDTLKKRPEMLEKKDDAKKK